MAWTFGFIVGQRIGCVGAGLRPSGSDPYGRRWGVCGEEGERRHGIGGPWMAKPSCGSVSWLRPRLPDLPAAFERADHAGQPLALTPWVLLVGGGAATGVEVCGRWRSCGPSLLGASFLGATGLGRWVLQGPRRETLGSDLFRCAQRPVGWLHESTNHGGHHNVPYIFCSHHLPRRDRPQPSGAASRGRLGTPA